MDLAIPSTLMNGGPERPHVQEVEQCRLSAAVGGLGNRKLGIKRRPDLPEIIVPKRTKGGGGGRAESGDLHHLAGAAGTSEGDDDDEGKRHIPLHMDNLSCYRGAAGAHGGRQSKEYCDAMESPLIDNEIEMAMNWDREAIRNAMVTLEMELSYWKAKLTALDILKELSRKEESSLVKDIYRFGEWSLECARMLSSRSAQSIFKERRPCTSTAPVVPDSKYSRKPVKPEIENSAL